MKKQRDIFHTRYQKLLSELRQQIVGGELREDELLPPEESLAKRYQLSRPSVRKALKELRTERLVYTMNGKGTFAGSGLVPHSRDMILGSIGPHSSFGTNPGTTWQGVVFRSFEREITLNGIRTEFLEMPVSPIPGRDFFERLKNKKWQGMMVYLSAGIPEAAREEIVEELWATGIPLVIVNYLAYKYPVDCVNIDNEWGGFLQAEYLLNLGHRHIAYIAPVSSAPWIEERMAGFTHAFRMKGLRLDEDALIRISCKQLVSDVDYEEVGRQGGKIILDKKKFTAVATSNDALARGLHDFLRENKVDVPDQVSLIGFDNAVQHRNLNLTTIIRPQEELGICAADLLLKKIGLKGDKERTHCVRIKPTLGIKSTTERCKGSLQTVTLTV